MKNFDRKAIMKRAWNDYKVSRLNEWSKNRTFAQSLRYAWKLAKEELAEEAKRKERAEAIAQTIAINETKEAMAVAAMTDSDKARLKEIDKQLFNIDMIDRWSDSDRQSYYRLQGERERLLAANSEMQLMVNETRLKEVA